MIETELTGEVWGLDALRETLKQDDDVNMTICSPGGSSLEGLQTARIIQERSKATTCKVLGFAASAAATIALACDKITMTKSDALMLHHCWTFAIGNKEELTEEIRTMQSIDTMLDGIMTAHCYDDTIQTQLDEGKDIWLTGEKAAELFDHIELVEVGASGKHSDSSFGKLVNDANSVSSLQAKLDGEAATNKEMAENVDSLKAEIASLKEQIASKDAEIEKAKHSVDDFVNAFLKNKEA